MQAEIEFDKGRNAFNNAKVYLSGKFSVGKKEIADLLEERGAVARQEDSRNLLNLTRDTWVIIAGESQSAMDLLKIDTLVFDGYNIPIITESGMYSILSGEKEAIFTEPRKELNITFDLLFNSRFSPIVHLNFYEYTHPLGRKEIFIHNVDGERHLLEQCLGNIGACPSKSFNPDETDYCWLRRSTIEMLKKGEKDEFIQIIENKYNGSTSTKFLYRFLIESEVIQWMGYRAREVGDQLSLSYLTRYLDSIYHS
ncbi:MAG: hypothetical protein LUC86_04765 [Prevotellaceae bacterium]|nr:hypothetical protein [Prevotellaceae bacterium]